MLQKRSCRLKDNRQLEQLTQHDPNNKDVIQRESIGHTILRDWKVWKMSVCNYSWRSTDNNGKRKYKLKEPCLPNNELFDPQKENERENFYFLILLCSTQRWKYSASWEWNGRGELSKLIKEDSSTYHDKLQKILYAQSKMTEINEARQAESEEKRVNKDNDHPHLMDEAKITMHDMAAPCLTTWALRIG